MNITAACGHTFQCSMLIVGVIVSGIKVAADTLHVKFFFIFIIIEVGCNTIIRNSLGVDVYVAGLARLVVDNLACVLKLAFALPINLFFVFCEVRPDVLHSCSDFGLCVLQCTFRGKVAGCAVGLYSAVAVVVHRLFPHHVRLCVVVARHTRLAC